MRRSFRASRAEDSTFEINLAPMLDIIVSIIPMLLLSVVFIRVMVIDTQVPQVVQKAIEKDRQKENRDVSISVHISSKEGIKLITKRDGAVQETKVAALSDGALDVKNLHLEIVKMKQQFPEVFRLELHPDEDVAYNDIVAVMDQVRTRTNTDPKVSFKDEESGKMVETDLLFPDVVFGNVVGG
jgi:biopolymer transport protein ExbD